MPDGILSSGTLMKMEGILTDEEMAKLNPGWITTRKTKDVAVEFRAKGLL